MGRTEPPPEQLSERELFAAFVEILDEPDESSEGYSEAHRRARRTALLAEIGDRLEALEAAKSLIGDTGPDHATGKRHRHEADREP